MHERLLTVSDGEEALRYLSSQGPHVNRVEHPMPRLVVLDLRLPKMSGLEVLKWIRSQPDLHYLPVVMLTSSNRRAKPGPFGEWVAMVHALKTSWLDPQAP
jgi:CheY-like chemotaxis protein